MDELQPEIRVSGPFPWLQRAGDRRFRFVRIHLPVPGLPAVLDGFTLVHLADVHLRRVWEPVLDHAIPLVMAEGPQIVLCSGDLVEDKVDHRPALPSVHRLLDEIRTPLGTYAVTGNHDGPKLVRHLRGAPVVFVNNQRREIPGVPLEVIGLGGWRARHARGHVFHRHPPKRAGQLRVVLCHYPFLIRRASLHLEPDLYLTGHTHGGQICLPGARPLLTHDPLPKRFAAGLHRWAGVWMNVSRGLGFSHWQLRTFCPPEVHVIRLRRA